MNRKAWLQIVQEAKNGNEALFSKAVTSNFEEHFYKSILKVVQDKCLTHEIYNSTMLKFWERFIRNDEDLPESNIDGYIFHMSRNAFYEIRRQHNNQRNLNAVSMESQEIVEGYKDIHAGGNLLYGEHPENEGLNRKQILFNIVQSLDETCQKIIHQHVLDGRSLVKIKEEIQLYGSYNAIVQKKKRCIKTLSKRFRAAIKEKKYILPQ